MTRSTDHDDTTQGPTWAVDDTPSSEDEADTTAAVLDALAERADDGMTVFELRTWVDADIDELEATLATLDEEGRIDVDARGDRTRIRPTGTAAGRRTDSERSLIDRVREWFRS